MRDDQIPNDSKSYDSKKNRHMEELNNLYQETLIENQIQKPS